MHAGLTVHVYTPHMLALCLMLPGTYYGQNYASIIDWPKHNQLLVSHPH